MVQLGGFVHCEKSRLDFVARTFALIALVHTVLHRVSCCYKTIRNAPKHYERLQNMSSGSNGVDQVCLLGKIKRDFVARTFALIAPVQYVLHQVSCSYETIPNAPKYYKTYWNITLGSNGVDRVIPLRKIPMWLRGTNFCINFTNSSRFAPSFVLLRNDPKCTQTLGNAPKHEFRVQCGGSGAFIVKNSDATLWHKLVH